jgi:hypothetical protein
MHGMDKNPIRNSSNRARRQNDGDFDLVALICLVVVDQVQ